MKTKKDILEHVIELLYEGLIMNQINEQYIEDRNDEVKDKDNFEYQAAKTEILKSIQGKLRQIDIAQNMLKEMEDDAR